MTEKQIQYFRETKRLKTDFSKDWLLFLLCITWILSLKYMMDYVFNLLDNTMSLVFFILIFGLISVAFVLGISLKLRAGIDTIKKHVNFNFEQLANVLKNESCNILRKDKDLIIAETTADMAKNSIVILIDNDLIYLNCRPKSIRPIAFLGDWKIRKRLREILANA